MCSAGRHSLLLFVGYDVVAVSDDVSSASVLSGG